MSRKDIAASLDARDPAWFRQTEDRGLKSAAYRKTSNQELASDTPSEKGLRLPGLSSEINHASTPIPSLDARQSPPPTGQPEQPPETRSPRSNVPPVQRQGIDQPAALPIRGGSSLSNANDSKPSEIYGAVEVESMLGRSSSIQGGGRSPSPTKGLGGFVQSAMMRRSDSVSKRWSVQANSGLKRGDSIASNKPIFSPPAAPTGSLGHARTLSRDPRNHRDGTSSPLTGSRPSSSHDQSQFLIPPAEIPEKTHPNATEDRSATPPATEPSLSHSPSKTLDPRRWSPTKASWLESALSKPESPRQASSKPEPPAWKLDMQRSKSSKDLQEFPKRPTSTFDSVTTGGLLRSPPGPEARLPPLFRDTLAKQTQASEGSPREEHRRLPGIGKANSVKPLAALPQDEPKVSLQTKQPENRRKVSQQETTVSSQSTDDKPQPTPETRPKPDFRSSLDKPPVTITPKPQTPPKTDFRANLKSRQIGDTHAKDNEPEFKAVFGKLKRTQTQNYVAPDVLKDNISKGKAALNTTGGPQQTKRVDEFKESILAKKNAMKQGGSVHKKDGPSPQEKPVAGVPEALARRKALHKSKPSADIEVGNLVAARPSIAGQLAVETVESFARRQESKTEPEPPPRPADWAAVSKPAVEILQQQGTPAAGTQAIAAASTRSVADLAEQTGLRTAHQRNVLYPTSTVVSESSQMVTALPKQPQRSPSPTKEVSGKLAARLNPSLAGLIAHVHSSKPQEVLASRPASPPEVGNVSQKATLEDLPGDTTTLQHMTKGRARGPKRRAPKADAKEDSENPMSSLASVSTNTEPAVSKPVQTLPTKSPWTANVRTLMKTSSQASLTQKWPVKQEDQDPGPLRGSEESTTIEPLLSRTPSESSPGSKVRPMVASKSPELRKVSNRGLGTEHKEERSLSRPTTAGKSFDIATDGTSQDSSTTMAPFREISQNLVARPLPLTPSKSKLNSPAKPLDRPSVDLHGKTAKSKPAGLGLNLDDTARKTINAGVLTPPLDSDPASPVRKSANVVREQNAASVSRVVHAFFGSIPRSADRYEFDTEVFLGAQATEPSRVKTLNKQIWEVKGDGKRSTLPPGQEHILFEECMYLCVHTFGTDKASKIIETYLWAGDSVADAAIEDAQLFCRKVARENSAKLEVVKQGKEPSKFFAALGGIVIIRRTKSSALYMLCGRRHLGHVAFDEVEMSASRLCSGFPFLISAKFGKLYLWKGRGSGIDEISAAKLISMDLSLTGEIEEILEGTEPASFWENFLDKKSFQSSDLWSVRSMDQHKGFTCKLYRVEPERPKSSGGFWGLRSSSPPKSSNKVAPQEINPYTQRDLDPDSVHVLDTYAMIYV